MDLFLQNVPPDVTHRALRPQLEPYIRALGIHDWSCHKPLNKNFAFITFLHRHEGERFLAQRGYISILGNRVTCKRGNNIPNRFLLGCLEKSAEDRRLAEQSQPAPERANVIFTPRKLSCGYYDYNYGRLSYSPEVEWETTRGYAKFANRALIIQSYNQYGPSWRVEIPYRIVESLVVSTVPPALTLTLWEAPRFYQAQNSDLQIVQDAMEALTFGRQQKPRQNARRRLTELPNAYSNSKSPHGKICGQSLVYQLLVGGTRFDEMVSILENQNILTVCHVDISAPPYPRRSLADWTENFNQKIRAFVGVIPFSVLYQMEALVKNGYLLPWTVLGLLLKMDLEFKAWLATLPVFKANKSQKGPPPVSALAVKKLFSQIPFPGIGVEASTFEVEELWKYLLENEKELRLGLSQELTSKKGLQNLASIHKITVTPISITLQGPDPEVKNRILRRFPDHSEYFIRVQFCDEDGADIQFNSNVSNQDVYDRYKNVFNNGIQIAGRAYKFLGFSHSSLRKHSAWFMAPFYHEDKLHTYFTVISYLGTFDDIYSPARCAARIGQAFSETPLAISLAANRISYRYVEDVKSQDGSRVFSDGVCTISRPVMDAIHSYIPHGKLQYGPTCFQIRWGGAKGMLALDTRLGEERIMCIRPSMVKFQSTDINNLEICDMANKPIRMVLNRQMIKILEDMGVTQAWFLRRQEEELHHLQLVTAHVENTIWFLKHQSIATRIGFPQLIRRLYHLDMDYRSDRFLSSVVEAAVLRELRLLKHKARIPVENGVTLFGIMDETGFLAEGEVYITFDDAPFIRDNSGDLNNRKMIVTRSPALHPGDIQIARNVVPPGNHPLRELRNCIIFAAKGQRDLPSCLSGGDLDGDVYNIIWDAEAVSQCQRIWYPADYPRVAPRNIERPVTAEDMTDFFVQFMATDQLGLIAVKHMILADQRDAGTDDQDCRTLAQMHSTGVDYSKTGIPVDMDQLKSIKWNRWRPDFLAPAPLVNLKDRTEIYFDEPIAPTTVEEDDDDASGPNHQYYKSNKVNGVLYRAIDERKIWYRNIKSPVEPSPKIWSDLLEYVKEACILEFGKLDGKEWDSAKKTAWQIRHAYEDAMWNATLEFSDHAAKRITELEVFTGSIFNKTGVQTRRQRDRSVQLKDEFERIAVWTERMIRKHNNQTDDEGAQTGEADTVAGADDSNQSLILSIACLDVSIRRDITRPRYGRAAEELQSFKVVAASCALREMDAVNRKKGIDYRQPLGY